jgi:hypothetical protein
MNSDASDRRTRIYDNVETQVRDLIGTEHEELSVRPPFTRCVRSRLLIELGYP